MITPSVFEDPVDELQHPELSIWRANVGAPVALDLARATASHLHGIDVISWNVAVGAGRVDALLEMVHRGAFGDVGADPCRPLVLLLQEAYRADASVPGQAQSRYHGGALHRNDAADVVQVARAFDMSIRYAPSMRNGAHQSDRGNAILSTFPLTVSHAFVLPHVRQRRVVVTAELEGLADLALMSAHLDVAGPPRGESWFGAFGRGRVAQVAGMIDRIADRRNEHCILIGADLNTQLGLRDPAMRAFVRAGLRPGTRVGRWRHTFHGPLRMMLDHVLFRSPTGRIARTRVTRLDEHPRDGGRRVFGSDHHPLLARVDFGQPVRRR